MGPRKNSEIPSKVKINDTYSTDINTVLDKWVNDFENLYNNPNQDLNDFYNNILIEKQDIENSMDSEQYVENQIINQDITLNEVKAATRKLKNNKSPGVDYIQNECLKIEGIMKPLTKLFQYCFENSIMPTIWQKAIITPIPKGSDKDPYTPLNYRGISLLSCVSKVYTSILNNRIMKYCEDSNVLVDEQNGFRQKRSCAVL